MKEIKKFGFSEDYHRIKAKRQYRYSHFENYIFPEYIKDYKDYYCDATDRYNIMKAMGESEGFSNVFYPLTQSVHDTLHSATYDSMSKIKAVAQTQEDEPYKKIAQGAADRAIGSATNKRAIKQTDRVGGLIGDGYCEIYYSEYLKTSYKVNDGVVIPKTKTVNEIVVENVDEFSLLYNPFNKNRQESEKFIRNLVSIDDVKKKFSLFFEEMTEEDSENGVLIKGMTDEKWRQIIETPKMRSTKDYSMIKGLQHYCNGGNIVTGTSQIISSIPGLSKDKPGYNFNNNFEVKLNKDENKNKIVECIKYIDGDRLAIILNGWMVYYGPNPFGFIPVYKSSFDDVPGVPVQKGTAYKLRSLQRQVNQFINRWIDMINGMSNPITMMDKGIFGDETPSALKLDRYKVYEKMPGKSYETMKLIEPNAVTTLQNGLNRALNQAYQIVGLNSYSMGGEGKVERVGGAPQIKSAILKARLVPLQENKNNMLSFMARDAMQLIVDYMPDKYKVKITDEDDGLDKRVELDKDALSGRFIFEFDNNSLKTFEDIEKRSEMVQALPVISDPVNKYILENEYLKTLGINPITDEERKKILKEQIDMEVYKQGLIAEAQAKAQPQQQQSQPTVDEAASLPPMPQMPVENPDAPLPGETEDAYFQRTGLTIPRIGGQTQ